MLLDSGMALLRQNCIQSLVALSKKVHILLILFTFLPNSYAGEPQGFDIDQKASQLAEQIHEVVKGQRDYRSLPAGVLEQEVQATAASAGHAIEAVGRPLLKPVVYSQDQVERKFAKVGIVGGVVFFVGLGIGGVLERADIAYGLHWFPQFTVGGGLLIVSVVGIIANGDKYVSSLLGKVIAFPQNAWRFLKNLGPRPKERALQRKFKQKLTDELKKRNVRVVLSNKDECEVYLEDKPFLRIVDLNQLEFIAAEEEAQQEAEALRVMRR